MKLTEKVFNKLSNSMKERVSHAEKFIEEDGIYFGVDKYGQDITAISKEFYEAALSRGDD